MQQATCLLACDPDAPRRARAFIRDVIVQWHLGAALADAELLVSEVVTNAVMHGGCDRTEVIATVDGGLTVAVSDAVSTPELSAGEQQPGNVGGWGLYLVDAIAQAWGVWATDSGKMVWFRIGAGGPPQIGSSSP
jgi:anti-sigma regulatory factor (Ser/Thr protein kinase)